MSLEYLLDLIKRVNVKVDDVDIINEDVKFEEDNFGIDVQAKQKKDAKGSVYQEIYLTQYPDIIFSFHEYKIGCLLPVLSKMKIFSEVIKSKPLSYVPSERKPYNATTLIDDANTAHFLANLLIKLHSNDYELSFTFSDDDFYIKLGNKLIPGDKCMSIFAKIGYEDQDFFKTASEQFSTKIQEVRANRYKIEANFLLLLGYIEVMEKIENSIKTKLSSAKAAQIKITDDIRKAISVDEKAKPAKAAPTPPKASKKIIAKKPVSDEVDDELKTEIENKEPDKQKKTEEIKTMIKEARESRALSERNSVEAFDVYAKAITLPSIQGFDKSKIRESLKLAFDDRPVATNDLIQLAEMHHVPIQSQRGAEPDAILSALSHYDAVLEFKLIANIKKLLDKVPKDHYDDRVPMYEQLLKMLGDDMSYITKLKETKFPTNAYKQVIYIEEKLAVHVGGLIRHYCIKINGLSRNYKCIKMILDVIRKTNLSAFERNKKEIEE